MGKREYFSLSLPNGIHSSGSFHYTVISIMVFGVGLGIAIAKILMLVK